MCPIPLTWALEHADPPVAPARFRCIGDLGQLTETLSRDATEVQRLTSRDWGLAVARPHM